ncbi:hypothetical protein AVEN_19543-1 [Araneus ventricosus]|uniref:Reverse transcriptase domain-containing protein n=1 Tax=Araneus ventricosus TaxID=182803 RepID=A0A4Y2RNL5_ARAVE|nr:hypothetical protein AVEN_19543-1 [Araneus ventricosus]
MQKPKKSLGSLSAISNNCQFNSLQTGQRRSQRESWERYVSSLNSTISSKKLWEKVKKASGIFTDRNINILYQNGMPVTSLQDIANCIASTLSQTSNSNTYPSSFQNHEKLAEKHKLNFKSTSYTHYNRDLCLSEVKKTSPGPDNISYQMIKHLSSSSLQNLLHLYNRIWHEHCFPSSWQQAIIIPISKPGKDPSNPLNYRPIALTNCLCKLMEKMVNRRLVYYLEHNEVLSPFQSGFRPGRCTIDNLLALDMDIRTTFLKIFDIEIFRPILTNRKADTVITRLRVDHTRFTHRHLLMGEQAPMCTQCNCTMSFLHILSECPNFNYLRLRYFHSCAISLTDLQNGFCASELHQTKPNRFTWKDSSCSPFTFFNINWLLSSHLSTFPIF